MAVEIPNSSVAVVYATFGPNGFWSQVGAVTLGSCADPRQLVAAIGQELVFDGLTITGYTTDAGVQAAFGGTWNATLNILNQSGQELDDTDLINQLNDAVNTAVPCLLMTSSAVTKVIGPSSGTNSGTSLTPSGQALLEVPVQNQINQAQSPKGTHQCGDPTWGFFDDPAQWLKCLTTGGLTTIGLLAIGLLVGIVIVIYAQSPKVPVPV